jgi:hypothetical protein
MKKISMVILLGLTVVLIASAQTPPGSTGAAEGDRHPVPSAASLKHDDAVEAALKVKGISVRSPFTSPQLQGASVVPLEIEFVNVSHQAITAFEYRVRIRFSDGRDAPSEGGEDLIKDMATARLLPEIADPNATFAPGAHRKIARNLTFRAGGAMPVGVEVYPSMVLFEDRTALGDANAIAKAAAHRKAEAEYMAGLIADLDSAASSNDPATTLASRIAQLKKDPPSKSSYKRARDLEGFSDVVQLFGKINNGHDIGREAFKGQLDEMRAQQKMLAEQSTIKRAE